MAPPPAGSRRARKKPRRSRPAVSGPAIAHSVTELPAEPQDPARVMARLRAARQEDWDFSRGRIFGSMCTQPLPIAARAADLFVTSNLGNPGLCPGTSRLEEEVLAMLLRLYHAPSFGANGSLVTGGTEANLTALWIARNISGQREVVLPRSAHFSFVKSMDLLSLRPRWVPVDAEGRADVAAVRKAVGPRTAVIVGLAGSTELGAVDPLPELSEIALEEGVHLHVDAAFGGFVLPFLEEAGRRPLPFDFALDGVTSLSSDPHKMGMGPIPSGALLLRRFDETRAIAVASPYLSAPLLSSLLGTRPSRNVAGTFSALLSLGRQGYVALARRVLDLTDALVEGAGKLGLEPVVTPTLNVVAFRHPNPMKVQSAMLRRGWDVSSVREPSALRFVVMPHVTRSSVDAMLADLAAVLREGR